MKFQQHILTLLALISLTSLSQEEVKIHYTNPKIQEIIKLYKIKTKSTGISVYSIQIASSESPEKIKNIKKKYTTSFPNEPIDEIFEPPYFKAIVGIYLDKKEAQKKLRLIQKKIKSAFVLKREIDIAKLTKNIN